MRRYILRCAAMLVIIIFFCISTIGYKSYTLRTSSWKIEPQEHLIFMGASHVMFAIDDREYSDIRNLSAASERYLYTYLKMKYLLRDNPQVDTIVLECAPTDLWEHTDDKYYNDQAKGHYPYYYQLFDWEEWKVFFPFHNIDLLASSMFNNLSMTGCQFLNERGGFRLEENMRMTQEAVDTLHYEPVKTDIAAGHKVNYKYLRKIITLCKEHNVALFFLYCPMLHPEYYYDQKSYYESYSANFSDIKLLDYSTMTFHNDERYDAHHLNTIGAGRFTKQLLNDIRKKHQP